MEKLHLFDTVEITNDIHEKFKGILVDYYERQVFNYAKAFLLINKKTKNTFHIKSRNGYYLYTFGSIRNIMSIKISRMVIVEKTMVDKNYLKDLFKDGHPLKHTMNRLFNTQESLEDTSNE